MKIQIGKEGGALGGTPLWSNSGKYDYLKYAPPQQATQYGVYRKSHSLQMRKFGSIPAGDNAPDPITQDVFTLSSEIRLIVAPL